MANDTLENKIKYTYATDSPSLVVSVTPLDGTPHFIIKVNNNNIIDAQPYEFFTATNGVFYAYDNEGKKYFEHLKVDGSVDYLPYNSEWDMKINFVNIGWRGANLCRYLRIDPYTGSNRLMEEVV